MEAFLDEGEQTLPVAEKRQVPERIGILRAVDLAVILAQVEEGLAAQEVHVARVVRPRADEPLGIVLVAGGKTGVARTALGIDAKPHGDGL